MTNSLLCIIPTRAGSKGIPRKNLRRIAGKPLFAHALATVSEACPTARVVVSSDDEVVLRWSTDHGYEALRRAGGLASDEATISDVATAVVDDLRWEGDVGVFQVTSPLVTPASIARAVEQFQTGSTTSLSSCVRESHLFWYDEHEDLGAARPLFASRQNRQFMRSKVLRETGAIQLIRASALRQTRQMVSDDHEMFELPVEESLDIDTFADLAVARERLEQGTIVFRLTANRSVGSGHLYHCLRLAQELPEFRLRFLLRSCDPFVTEVLETNGFSGVVEDDLRTQLEVLRGNNAALVVNDVLDTREADVLIERQLGYRIVTVEDLGPGARHADWVINALYPLDAAGLAEVSTGPRWATLREEFLDAGDKTVRAAARSILVTFGGTDPSGLASRCARLVSQVPGAEVRVIVGPGAAVREFPSQVTVLTDVKNMAAEMADADVILTSAGRTVYEAAATGTPVVVLAQNAREATHAHISFEAGVVFLGIGALTEDSAILNAVERLLGDHGLRQELSARLRSSVDLRGAARIAHRIRGMMQGLEP